MEGLAGCDGSRAWKGMAEEIHSTDHASSQAMELDGWKEADVSVPRRTQTGLQPTRPEGELTEGQRMAEQAVPVL